MLDKNEILKISRSGNGALVEMNGGKKTMQGILFAVANSARKIGVTEKELIAAVLFGYADEQGTAIMIQGLRRKENEQD